MTTISQYSLKLIKNLIFSLALFGQISWANELYKMQNKNGASINLKLAVTRSEHTKGLSGLRPNEFKNNEGMLFVNPEVGPRRFWMPNTYFNLDIIFLDENFKIVAIEKNVPAHPGQSNSIPIYTTNTYIAQFVLEIKAGTRFGKNLNKDDVLKFIGPKAISEIVLKTRLPQ